MKIQLKNLQSNPFRDAKNYPLIESKLAALKESILETGFWQNIPVRKNGTGYQIHYGHHRIQALKDLYTPETSFDFPVENVSDEIMHKRMVAENAEEWGATTKQIDENVRSTKLFLEEHLEVAAKYTDDPEHWMKTGLKGAAENQQDPIGRNIVTNYLKSINSSWTRTKVEQSLTRLHTLSGCCPNSRRR